MCNALYFWTHGQDRIVLIWAFLRVESLSFYFKLERSGTHISVTGLFFVRACACIFKHATTGFLFLKGGGGQEGRRACLLFLFQYNLFDH